MRLKQRAGSKQSQVLQMLVKPAGATIEAIMTATGWQAHSARGFFAGVVRKELKLTLTSEAADSGRVYRVAGDTVAKSMWKWCIEQVNRCLLAEGSNW